MNKIHFIGVKGVGMAPLAIIAKEAGFEVIGCDVDKEFITDHSLIESGIIPLKGFDTSHLIGVDIVITTGANGGMRNPEVLAAKENGIDVIPQGKAVGLFMDGSFFKKKFTGIAVAGCHGKTTTTAMIATIFAEAGLDPSFVIGTSDIHPLGLPGHFGKGTYFIAEADEYMTMPASDKTAKFLHLHPKISVITNIEYDHPDVYANIEQVIEAYRKFAQQIPDDGLLVLNGDDKNIQIAVSELTKNIVTIGYGQDNDYKISDVSQDQGTTTFKLTHEDIEDKITLQVMGEYNARNAACAYIVATKCGLGKETIKRGLHSFAGTKRRMEYRGFLASGAMLYDDYAHHPTEIQATLHGLKAAFTNKKIICIFQPHTYSRTKELFDDFVSSFDDASLVILTDIFASAREKTDHEVSSEKLTMRINTHGQRAIYLPKLSDVIQYLSEKKFDASYIIITMGAGDIYTIVDKILL